MYFLRVLANDNSLKDIFEIDDLSGVDTSTTGQVTLTLGLGTGNTAEKVIKVSSSDFQSEMELFLNRGSGQDVDTHIDNQTYPADYRLWTIKETS